MNIKLLLDNKEIELSESISFPMTKSFDNIYKPTDIFVDYSKNINIPATAHNNKILGNAYRLDKHFSTGDQTLGLYMNPMKRIPAKLLYNNELIFDGYAKYVSATDTNGQISYNMNLYGAVGDVFQTLLSVVVDENKLSDEQKAEPDGGLKYVLNDQFYTHPIIDKNTVLDCWEYTGEPASNTSFYHTNTFGFAPAYRGFYNDFESGTCVALESEYDTAEPRAVEDVLKEEWIKNYKATDANITDDAAEKRIEAIDIQSLIGDGIKEQQIHQFRSYEQKPFIYFCRLMRLYQEKCKELTGYDIKLDPTWFNANNPYWTRLCYMFDYLGERGVNDDQTKLLSNLKSISWGTQSGNSTSQTIELTEFTDAVNNIERLSIAPFDLAVVTTVDANNADPLTAGVYPVQNSVVRLDDNSYILADVTIANSNGTVKTLHYWGANDQLEVELPDAYNADNFVKLNNITTIDYVNRKLTGSVFLRIPTIDVPYIDTTGLKISVKMTLVGANERSIVYKYYNPRTAVYYTHYIKPELNSENYLVQVGNIDIYTNWRFNTTLSLKNLYTKDDSLFNVILQYTKMHGLVWASNYTKKEISVMTRQSFFSNYTVDDWSDKVDASKNITIEPVSFASKYVNFGYDETDGYRYSGYKNKYGIEYGSKRIKTKYEFDTATTELLEGAQPSSMSTKTFIPLETLREWDTITPLSPITDPVNFIDCEDNDQAAAISLNNWYFRCDNVDVWDNKYYMADASNKEKEDNQYYWLWNDYADLIGAAERVNVLPLFSIVYDTKSEYTRDNRTVGCLMNTPNEDFTKDKATSSAQGNYIYDLCWRDYINERYNSNNKKVTAYFYLTVKDFNLFNFNRLVLYNNQLFTVNKIIDFDPVANASTKVELIQVNDINAYIQSSNLFPIIAANKDAIIGRGAYGSKTIYFRVLTPPTGYEIISDSQGEVYVEDSEREDDILRYSYTISWDVDEDTQWTGVFRVYSDDYQYDIPIYLN